MRIRKRRGGLVLLAASGSTFVGFGSLLIYSFSVFLKPLSREFGWSRSRISLAFTVTALMIGIASPVLGRLLDRYPARRIILPCVLIFGLAFASMSLMTRNIWHFLAIFAVMGAVGNGTCQLAYARVLSTWFDRGRGRAFAAMMAGSGLGSMVFPPLAQYLISAYSWRWAYALLGLLVLVGSLPLAYLFVYEREGSSQDVQRARPRGEILQRNLWSFPFLCLTSALILFSIAENGLVGHLSPLLTDRGFGVQQATGVIAVMGAATLISKLTTGYLMDRFNASKSVAVLFVFTALGILVVLYGTRLWIPYLGAVLIGAGMGAQTDVVPFLLTRYFGLGGFSELYGYTWSAYAVAAAAGPLFMGQLFDRNHSYEEPVLALSAMVAGSAVLLYVLPKYKRRDTPEIRAEIAAVSTQTV